eukprot:4800650-Alexandrium_andersonii.AAC.1
MAHGVVGAGLQLALAYQHVAPRAPPSTPRAPPGPLEARRLVAPGVADEIVTLAAGRLRLLVRALL